jgi:D-alanyl-D-alanine carboxypeptidase
MSLAKKNRQLNRRCSLFSIFCCALLLFANMGKADAQMDSALDHALQEIIDEARKEFNTVGLAVGIHIPGHGIWTGSSGFSEIGNEIPMRSDHLFRVASITKTFVATTVFLLVEDGVLDLGDSVEQWLPGLVANGENITIRQLLNHTSGVHDFLVENSYWESVTAEPNKVWGRDEVVNFSTANGPDFDPGEGWNYTNTGYILLGMIVEKASGNTLTEQIRIRLLEPLKLNNTFFAGGESVSGELVHGYSSSNGQLVDVKSSLNTAFETSVWAAGGMISTAEDIARWADALYSGKVLKRTSLEQMLTFVVPSFGFGVGYGFGVSQQETSMGLAIGHPGGIPGFSSSMFYVVEQQISIVVLANQESDTGSIRDFALRRIMQIGEIFPAEHVQVLGDDLAPGWSIVGAGGAESAELTASGPVYEGNMAASIQVAKPASFSAKWRVEITPETPLLPLGYTAVRLAIHPGDMESAVTSNFSIALNGGRSTENLLRGPEGGLVFDAKRKEWQVIEVPIEFFQLFGPIEHIDVQGNMGGTFYIDDGSLGRPFECAAAGALLASELSQPV